MIIQIQIKTQKEAIFVWHHDHDHDHAKEYNYKQLNEDQVNWWTSEVNACPSTISAFSLVFFCNCKL